MAHIDYSRTYPVALQAAYDQVMPVPLERILGRRHLAIPAVRSVVQSGPWGQRLGQSRTIKLADGGSMDETLTVLDAPNAFGYSLGKITGPMKLLIAGVDGLWAFAPSGSGAGSGTTITWSWEITPTTVGRLVMPAFVRMWPGMAKKAFDEIGILLRPEPDA